MKRLLLLILSLGLLVGAATAQQGRFDVEAYQAFLEAHTDISAADLQAMHPTGLFVEGVAARFDDAFYSDSINVATGDTLRMMTRYQLESVGFVERGNITTPVFQLHRDLAESPVTNGTAPPPSTWHSDGRSLSTLSSFKISMLDRDGRVTTDVETGDYIRIAFNLIPQFPVEPEYLRELYWSTTLKVRPFWNPPPGA